MWTSTLQKEGGWVLGLLASKPDQALSIVEQHTLRRGPMGSPPGHVNSVQEVDADVRSWP